MEKFYCKYVNYPNWQDTRNNLLKYYNSLNLTGLDRLWYAISLEKMEENLCEVVDDLRHNGIIPLQLLFIIRPGPTDLKSTDINSSKTVYIHYDLQDEVDQDQFEVVTRFVPKYTINIPLINCDNTLTLFYELIDNSKQDLPWGGWGEEVKNTGVPIVDPTNVKLVDSIVINKPAILRVDGPHATHNPTENDRLVASIRIDESSEIIKEIDRK